MSFYSCRAGRIPATAIDVIMLQLQAMHLSSSILHAAAALVLRSTKKSKCSLFFAYSVDDNVYFKFPLWGSMVY